MTVLQSSLTVHFIFLTLAVHLFNRGELHFVC